MPENLKTMRDGFKKEEAPFILTDELMIQIPALPRPTLAELQAKFDWIKRIERDTSPTEAITLRLGTVLRPDEERISGTEYERRRASLTGIFGYQQLNWLVKNQDEYPTFKVLLGQIYIDGPGLIVVDAGGYRNFPSLNEACEPWHLRWRWRWLGDKFGQVGRIAVSGPLH